MKTGSESKRLRPQTGVGRLAVLFKNGLKESAHANRSNVENRVVKKEKTRGTEAATSKGGFLTVSIGGEGGQNKMNKKKHKTFAGGGGDGEKKNGGRCRVQLKQRIGQPA